MDYTLIGQQIRTLRQQHRLSQQYLAELVDSSVPYISQLECGAKGPSLSLLVRLADALGSTADYLLLGNQQNGEYLIDMMGLLNDCSEAERTVILDVARAVKQSLRSSGLVA